jgi:ATP-dependent DNA ligase
MIMPSMNELRGVSPPGPDWVHEINHDGYRLIVRRDGEVGAVVTGATAG